MVENAEQSLGLSPFVVLRRVVIPQVMPGMFSGSLIVFALTASAFATPPILGDFPARDTTDDYSRCSGRLGIVFYHQFR